MVLSYNYVLCFWLNLVNSVLFWKNCDLPKIIEIIIKDFNTIWNESVFINSNEIEFLNDIDGKKLVGEIIFNFKDIENIGKNGYVEGKVKYFSYEWNNKRYVKSKTYGFRY